MLWEIKSQHVDQIKIQHNFWFMIYLGGIQNRLKRQKVSLILNWTWGIRALNRFLTDKKQAKNWILHILPMWIVNTLIFFVVWLCLKRNVLLLYCCLLGWFHLNTFWQIHFHLFAFSMSRKILLLSIFDLNFII